VLTLPVHQFNQPAPRIVAAITTLAKHFHPEACTEANATATPTTTEFGPLPTRTVEPTGTESSKPAATDSPTTPGQPGFGVVMTLVVAVLLGALRSRRD